MCSRIHRREEAKVLLRAPIDFELGGDLSGAFTVLQEERKPLVHPLVEATKMRHFLSPPFGIVHRIEYRAFRWLDGRTVEVAPRDERSPISTVIGAASVLFDGIGRSDLEIVIDDRRHRMKDRSTGCHGEDVDERVVDDPLERTLRELGESPFDK